MRLYKFVPNKEIALQVSIGVYRFYELMKYKKLEEKTGRSDLGEGAVSFNDDECSKPSSADGRGVKFFSHGAVSYYDIHSHPGSIERDEWKEVYLKHACFSYQREYRAALFASDHFFERVGKTPMLIEREIRDTSQRKMDFNLKLLIRSGVDEAGWRYVEFDVSEFQANLLPEPCPVLTLAS